MADAISDTQVIEAAARLGELLAAHPKVAAFEAIVKKLEADTDAQRLVTDLRRHQQTMAEKDRAGQPIEVSDKHKMRDLQAGAAGNALLREMQTVEMDYVDLMRQVDQKIQPR
ncbi:MAG: YlbF family regulator [Algisphaera sp.]